MGALPKLCVGLRGAVAFALATDLSLDANNHETRIILATTLILVIFTVIVFGGTTVFMLRFLGIPVIFPLSLSFSLESHLLKSSCFYGSHTQVDCSVEFFFIGTGTVVEVGVEDDNEEIPMPIESVPPGTSRLRALCGCYGNMVNGPNSWWLYLDNRYVTPFFVVDT